MNKTKKPITPENMRELACRIIDYLDKNELFFETNIYVGGKVLTMPDADRSLTEDQKKQYTLQKTKKGTPYWEKDCPKCPVAEYSRPDTVTMTYEGPLYHEMTEHFDGKVYRALDALFTEYGLIMEMGYAWSLCGYPDDY